MILDAATVRHLASLTADELARWQAPADVGPRDLADSAKQWAEREPGAAVAVIEVARRAADGDRELLARVDVAEARVLVAQGSPAAALSLIDAAEATFTSLGAEDDVRRVGLGKAQILAMSGRLLEAADLLDGLTAAAAGDPDALPLVARAHLNRGVVASLMGDLAGAEASFAQASRSARDLGDRRLARWAEANRANALLRGGFAGRALELVEPLLAELDPAEEPSTVAEVHETRGRILAATLEITAARESLETAEAIFEDVGAHERVREVRLATAELLAEVGLSAEARHSFEAVAAATTDTDVLQKGRALLGAAHAAAAEGGTGVETYLAQVESLLRGQTGDTGTALLLDLYLLRGREQARAGRLDVAATTLDDARALAVAAGDRFAEALVLVTRGELLLDVGALSEAGAIAVDLDVALLDARLDAAVGNASLAIGDLDSAIARLDRAVERLEGMRSGLGSLRERRSAFRARDGVYRGLVTALVRRGGDGDLDRAFDVLERTRARSLLDLMERRLAAAGGPDADELRRRRADLGQLYDQNLRHELGGERGADLARRIQEAESEIQGILDEMLDQLVADPVTPTRMCFTLAEVHEAALVSYFWAGTKLAAFVFEPGIGLRMVDLPVDRAAVRTWCRRFEAEWTWLRPQFGLERRWADHLLQLAESLLGEIRERCWVPLGIDGTTRVVVASAPELDGLAWPAVVDLHGDGPELTVVPSLSVWATCEGSKPAVGGTLVLAFGGPEIAHIREEARSVADAYPDSTILLNDAATRASLEACAHHSTVHIACHGTYRPENPMLSGLRLADSWVHAVDLASTDLHGRTLVLSACESARRTILPESEADGFVRAALTAGARTIVGSTWLVNDGSTAEWMRAFHRAQAAGATPSSAAREAQRTVRERWPHPYHWAGFSVVGAGFSPRPVLQYRAEETRSCTDVIID